MTERCVDCTATKVVACECGYLCCAKHREHQHSAGGLPPFGERGDFRDGVSRLRKAKRKVTK